MFEWIKDESNSSWIILNCFQVSNSCLMILGCPLLLGSSDRRLRRRAATEPLRNKQVFTEQLIPKRAIYILMYLII